MRRFAVVFAFALLVIPSQIATAAEPNKFVQVGGRSLGAAPVTSLVQGAPASSSDSWLARLREAKSKALAPRNLASPMSYGATVDFSPLVSRIGRDVALRIRPGVGTPMEIKGTRLHPAAAVTGNMDRSVATAQQFLQQNRHILRLRNPAEELRLVSQTKDSLGLRHLKFDQHYRGLPVWPAQLIVHLDEAGDVYLLNGAYVPTPRRLLTQPAISAERAAKLSRDLFEGATRAYVSKAELVVYAPDDRAARLAWRLDIDVTFEARWTVLIDAQTGVKLTAISRVQEANVLGSGKDLFGVTRPLNVWGEGGSFFMVDTSKPMYNSASAPPNPETTQGGIFVFDVKNAEFPPAFYVNSSNVNSWSPRDAVSAAFWLSQTHDYFLNRHNRNSLDGQGGSILGFVRLRQNFRNAFWDGQAMFFGDGLPFAGSQDVVGHELTHGVTSNSADLVYQGQSGALNEAFSDIFGEMVEAFALGSNDWLIGSKLPQPFRSMIDPEIFGDPGRMSKFVQTTEDNGGVHTNSGIINRAYYLLAAGLPGAIGASDAERIFYRALTIHLSKNSQFLDARLACMQAAEELFGAGSAQALKVAEAFDAVEVFDTTQPPPPPNIPPVAAADSTLFLYVEGGILKLGRRETAQGDPSQGVELAAGLDFVRPSITGDGALAVYVNTSSDACFIASVGGTPSCLGADGLVHSVAMSPDGSVFSFVLLDGAGNPDNRIKVVDLATDTERDFVLLAPVLDGTSQNTVIAADVMDFTASGRYLIYDAFNLLTLNDGSEIGAWSIYAIDFATNQVLMIVPPIPGLDIGFPAIAQASDNRATFEATDVESGETAVLAEDLSSGTIKTIALVADAITVPSYTGDDSAIVFGVPSATATGRSLMRQALASDHLTPTGAASSWLDDAAYGVIYRRGSFSGPGATCIPSATTMCLNGGRFAVNVAWRAPQGQNGEGQAVQLTPDTGYFWFFGSSNVEMVIKILDACAFSGNYWVFSGGLTDVATIITVTDTLTQLSRTYTNPQGIPFQPLQDTSAFATCFAGIGAASELNPGAHRVAQRGSAPPTLRPRKVGSWSVAKLQGAEAVTDSCTPSATALCLSGGRFKVETFWKTADGQSGIGQAVPLTADTGFFWFFNSANVEMITKILNACGLNSRFWVFAGGLTNVEVRMRVTDTLRNVVKEYTNPLNKKFLPIQDTGALETCP